jgi:hypothetical protein
MQIIIGKTAIRDVFSQCRLLTGVLNQLIIYAVDKLLESLSDKKSIIEIMTIDSKLTF